MQTNGGYINFSLDKNDINEILNDINKKAKKEEFQAKKIKTYTELFYYPLALSILFLLIAYSSMPKFKRISLIQVFIMITIFSNYQPLLFASILDFQTIQKANEAYNSNDFKTSSKEFSSLEKSTQRDYNLANSLYKENKYKEAIDIYKNIKTEDNNDLKFKNLHNLGNSYVKINDLKSALNSYEKALKLKEDKQTRENYETVKKALQNKNNKNNDKEKEQNSKNEKDKKNKDKEENKDKEKKNKDEKSENNSSKEKDNSKEKSKNNINKNELSKKEEKKWLQELEKKQTQSLTKKMQTNQESISTSPW
ncbi:tetratricopeptide repeat protein [Poseidonibacter sp.]|uniref:tetratricopeptide repeat protein n=1 Tax=Poseidonibacter sp. TaxID=2321188 RepID=UPI003C7201C9